MKKLLSLFVLLNLFGLASLAQNTQIDSLLAVLKAAEQDTAKVNTLNMLSKRMWRIRNYEQAKEYADEAYTIASKAKQSAAIKKGMAVSYNNNGIICERQGNYSDALKNYAAGLKISEDIADKKGMVHSYYNIGLVHREQGNYPDALKNLFASLKISEEIGYKVAMAYSFNNIGLIYTEQGNYPAALNNHLASLRISEELGDKRGIAHSYNNIGTIYMEQGNYPDALKNYLASLKIKEDIGDKKGIAGSYSNIGSIYMEQGNYTDALKNLLASLKIKEKIGDRQGISSSYYNIGLIYMKQGNYPDALKNLLAALKLNEEIGNKEAIAASFIELGSVNTKLNRFLEARKYLNDGLSLSIEIGTKDNTKEAYSSLSELDSTLENYEPALEYYKLYTVYKDSLLNEENNRQIVQMKTIYETEKKDAEIALLNKDREIQEEEIGRQKLVRNGFIGGFAIVLLFAGVFLTQRNRIGKEKKRSDELLLNILPAEVAEELKDKGYADAKQFDEVTVLFTDFKGFTGFAEKLTAHHLVKEINDCFKTFDAIMEKYGIEKIKTIGDSYMAAGGLPVANQTNADDVVNAAIEIRDFMLNRPLIKFEDGTEEKLQIRFGINSGPVVAGIVGIKKFQYDIWGDTVNTASRMESSGEAGKVNISQTTYELVKDKFTCEYRGEIEAKGKGKVKMYFVGPKSDQLSSKKG